MSQILELSPQALAMQSLDLKAANDTEYLSGLIDLSDYRMFMASLNVDVTGAAGAGAVALALRLFANDLVTVLGTVDLLTAVGTTADRSELVCFGRGLAAAKQGNGTLGSSIGVLKVFRWAKLVLTVSTQSDAATSCLGNVRLYGGN